MPDKHNKVLFLLKMCILLAGFSCNQEEKSNDTKVEDLNRGKDSIIIADTSVTEKDVVFKDWLLDTLKGLDSSIVIVKHSGKVSKQIRIPADSLTLSIITKYDLIISSKENAKEYKDVDLLFMLLQEYDEFPKEKFRIKFEAEYYYTPSPVPSLPYDLIVEMTEIAVIEKEGKFVSQYGYIRGRLAYKNVSRLNETGSKQNERVDFIWKDNKLIKRKL